MAMIRDFAFQGAQMLLVLLLSPLLTGFVRKVKARLLRRQGPPLFAALSRSRPADAQGGRPGGKRVLAIPRHSLHRFRRHLGRGITGTDFSRPACLFSWSADLIALIALLGSARFFLALAGLDVGTSFGGIGSSREVMIASLAEPAMLMIVFTLALIAGSTQLSIMAAYMVSGEVGLRVSLGLALLALIMVGIAENARIPIDNPATHLELTMVHEAMVLEYSGRHLALIELSPRLKLLLYRLADRLPLCTLGHRAARRGCRGDCPRCRRYLGKLVGRRHAAGRLRDLDCQDARVPRAGISRRGVHVRPSRRRCCCSFRGVSDAPPRASTSRICSPGRWCW